MMAQLITICIFSQLIMVVFQYSLNQDDGSSDYCDDVTVSL